MQWIRDDVGAEKLLRSAIYKDTIPELLTWLKNETSKVAQLVTANDLDNILTFTDPGIGQFTRICDLQGFFLKAGGFAIADPDGIVKDESLNYSCYDKYTYPTTGRVIDALREMVKKLRKP